MLKFPSISKKVRCFVSPTFSMSVVRKHFCDDASRGLGGSASPEKYDLNCTMPALVSKSVGSPTGISDDDGVTRCPRSAKKSR